MVIIFISLHSQVVGIFCLNTGIQQLNSNCVRTRDYEIMKLFNCFNSVAILVAFAPSWCFSTVYSFCLHQALWYKWSPPSLIRLYHYTAIESTEHVLGSQTSWTPTLVLYKFDFIYPSIFLQCKISRSSGVSFWFFLHELRYHKVRKVANPSFWK